MKLRITLLVVLGFAGAATSIAFADGGHHHDSPGTTCKHARLGGTASAPQSFTVTVGKAGKHSSFTSGQTVTVALGATGQTLRFQGVGCVGTDGTLTVNEAEFHVQRGRSGDHHGTTTTTTTTETTSTVQQTTTS